MATAKKNSVKAVENEIKENVNPIGEIRTDGVEIAAKNEKLSLADMAGLVNTIVDSVINERNSSLEYSAEYLEVVENYVLISAFYPQYGIADAGLGVFFNDYVDGVFFRELNELGFNTYAQYIKRAVEKKIAFKLRQIENPLVNSLTRLVDIANVLAKKYVDDIDNVGAADIKSFLNDFAKLAKTANPRTVTDAVIKMHKGGDDGMSSVKKPASEVRTAPEKRSRKTKKSIE